MNCVNLCTSPMCFEEVYGESNGGALEDGEIDLDRKRKFETCLRKEEREKRLSKNKTDKKEKKKNKKNKKNKKKGGRGEEAEEVEDEDAERSGAMGAPDDDDEEDRAAEDVLEGMDSEAGAW